MAKNEDITTRFKADIKDFKKNINEAGKQIKLINSEFTKASDGTKKWENSVDGLSAKVNQLKGKLGEQNKKLSAYKEELKVAQKYEEESKNKVEALKKALEKAKQEYGEDSKEVKKLEKELLSAEKQEAKFSGIVRDTTIAMNKEEGAIKKTTAELNDYENKLSQTKKSQSLSGKASKLFNKGVSAMGNALKGFAGNAAQFAIDKLKELGEETIENGKAFTSAMSKVKAISSANSGEYEKLSKKALEMGKKTKFSATESAEAFTYMSMAGWKTKDMLDGIEGIMNLASASGEDLAKTSDIVTDSLTAFKLKAKDTNKFVDVLAQASRNSNTNVSLMGESFKYVAPIAGQFGYKVEDVALGLGVMANSGIKATTAGTAMRAILTRLATNAGATKNSIGALDLVTKKLGVRFYDEQGKIRPFADFLTDLREKWKGLSQSEKINFAKKIAGMNALSGFNTLVEASEDDFKKLKTAIDGADGAAKEMSETMEDNLEGDMKKMDSAIESLEQKIYKRLEPGLRNAAKKLTIFFNEAEKSFDKTDKKLDEWINGKKVEKIKTELEKAREEISKLEKTQKDDKKDPKKGKFTYTIKSKEDKQYKNGYELINIPKTYELNYKQVKKMSADFAATEKARLSDLKAYANSQHEAIKNKAKVTYSNMSSFGEKYMISVKSNGKETFTFTQKELKKMADSNDNRVRTSGNLIERYMLGVKNNANSSSKSIASAGESASNKIKNASTNTKSKITNNANSAKESVKKASSSASNSFDSASSKIKNAWKKATDKIKNTDLKKSTKYSGESAIDGIIEGMQSRVARLWSSIKDVTKRIVGFFERNLKVNSPSKVMRDRIGVNIGKGIAVGISQSTKTISKSISKLAKSTISDAKSSFTKSGFDTVAKNLINSFNKTIEGFKNRTGQAGNVGHL